MRSAFFFLHMATKKEVENRKGKGNELIFNLIKKK